MTVHKSDYKRQKKHHKVMINIRLRCISPGRVPKRRDIEEVLTQILESNTVPLGWQVAFVEWGNPSRSSTRWKDGDLGDLQEFRAVIEYSLRKMRIGVVRNDELTGEEL